MILTSAHSSISQHTIKWMVQKQICDAKSKWYIWGKGIEDEVIVGLDGSISIFATIVSVFVLKMIFVPFLSFSFHSFRIILFTIMQLNT